MATLPIQTLVAKGLSNSKRIRAIEANTEANANASKEIVKALSSLDALKPSGGSNGGNGNGNGNGNDSPSKDDLEDAVNTGFKDGLGDIRQGFANLGAGLGPLRIIVDFVKNVGDKLMALFGIIKGLGKVIFSIPKALFGFFRSRKKKDRIDKKNVLENKKATGKLTKMFALLKPVAILALIGAISFGLIKLYNWLARRGLGDYFERLGQSISDSILDFKIMLAEAPFFGDSTKAAKLREEKVVRAVERLDENLFTVRQEEDESDDEFKERKEKMVKEGNAVIDADGKAILAGVAKYDMIINELTGKVNMKTLQRILNEENTFGKGLLVDPTGRTDFAREGIDTLTIGKGESEGTEKTLDTSASFSKAIKTTGVENVETAAIPSVSFSASDIGDDGTFRTNRILKDPRNGEPFTLATFTDFLNTNLKKDDQLSVADVRTGLARHPNLKTTTDTNSNTEYVTLSAVSRERGGADAKMLDENVSDYTGSDLATDIGSYVPGLILDSLALVTDTVSYAFGGDYGDTARLFGSSDGTFRYGFNSGRATEYTEDTAMVQDTLLSPDQIKEIFMNNEVSDSFSGDITMTDQRDLEGNLLKLDELGFLQDVKNIIRFNEKYEGVDADNPYPLRPNKRRQYYKDLADIQISGERLIALKDEPALRDAGIGKVAMSNIVQNVNETFNTYGKVDAEGGGFDYIKEHSIAEGRYGNLID